jgi:transcriptional regulator with XRE-family HTH domain
MDERGFNQSDIARKLWGDRVDTRGHTVAKSRDRISVWVRGAGYPSPKNLQRLADALGVDKKDLTPDATTIDFETPELTITAIAGHPDAVHLQVNRLVRGTIAAKVMALLTDPDA